MRLKNFTDKYGGLWKNLPFLILAAAMPAFAGAFCPLVFGFNDDAMMRSILSGDYLGVPDGHAVYMRYPLTGLLALLYRAAGGVPWFSLFFAGCVTVCVFLLLKLTAENMPGRRAAGVALAAVCAVTALFRYYASVHYTVAAALLGGTALFLLSAGRRDGALSKKRGVLSLILLYLCYMVRSQVFFLTLPFLGAVLLWNMRPGLKAGEGRAVLLRSGAYAGVLAAGILAAVGVNGMMYGGEDWREYEAYNEARTRLYDYTGIPPYDKHPELYERLGISREQYDVLEAYGTVLDNRMSAGQMAALSEAAAEINAGSEPAGALFRERFREYFYRTLHRQDFPYNALVLALYGLAAVFCLAGRDWGRLWLLFALGGGRSLIWLYLMMRGRYPERVTVSLYLIEALLLSGFCLQLAGRPGAGGPGAVPRWKSAGVRALLLGAFLLCIPAAAGEVKRGLADARAQQYRQREWRELETYMADVPDAFFYLDVYSVTDVTGMQYEPGGCENYMLLGGWMTRSALQEQKQAGTGYPSAAGALAAGENVYLVADRDRSTGWVENYLAFLGYDITFEPSGQSGRFVIYRAAQGN